MGRVVLSTDYDTIMHSCRRPALQLNNIELPSGSITARLLPFPADNAIDVRTLSPDRNAHRAVSACTAGDGSQLLPTPLYNTSILQVLCCSFCRPWHLLLQRRHLGAVLAAQLNAVVLCRTCSCGALSSSGRRRARRCPRCPHMFAS